MRVFVKGAPEQLVFKCTSTFDEQGSTIYIDEEEQNRIVSRIVGEDFCKRGLRCLAFAYKDYTIEDFEAQRESHNQFVNDEDRLETFFSDLKLISIFAMEDNLRSEVSKAVKIARGGSINVRLVSGDHINTAIEFAVQAKIIKREDS